MTMYQKIQDGRRFEKLQFYCKWRPFCFFLKKIEMFLDIYVSYELRILENIQIHTSIIDFVSLS